MIRSCRIPPVLDRICDDQIHSAVLVTLDGELLGANTDYAVTALDASALGTLLADMGSDYVRLGEEMATLAMLDPTTANSSSSNNSTQQQQSQPRSNKSVLQCLLFEMELGLVGAAVCGGIDCLVVAVAHETVAPGLLKARLQALAGHVQESFTTLTEAAS